MSAENVIINFVGDTSELKPVENALDGIIAQGGEVAEVWKKSAAAMNAQNKTSVESSNKLAKSIEAIAVAAKSMDKAVIGGAYANYLKQIQTQLGLTNKELIVYIQNAKKAAQESIFNATTDEEIDQITLSIEAMNDQLKQLGAIEDETGDKTASLRSRLKAAKEELVAMTEAGLQGTPAFKALQQKAGELDDQVRDLNASVKNLGSDTKNIDGLVSIVGGVAGGYAAAQGAAALFGEENEDVQKALLKVNAAMSILQGLQQIQNVLQKESAAMLLLSEVRTKALAVGQQFLSATTLQSAAATNVLRGALIASGIGAFVVVLGLAADAMGAFDDKVENSAENLKKLNEQAEAFYEGYKKIAAVNQNQIDRNIQITKNEEEIKSLELQKGSLRKIAELKKQNLDLEIDNLNIELLGIEAAQRRASDNTLFTERELKVKSDLYKKRQEAGRLDIELSQGLTEQNKKNAEEAKKAREEAQKQVELIAKSITALADADVARKKLIVLSNKVDSLKSINDITEAEINAIQKRRDEQLKSNTLTEGERQKIQAEAELQIAEIKNQQELRLLENQKSRINSRLLAAKKGSEDEYENKLEFLNKQEEIELSQAQLTQAQIAEIKSKYDKERVDALRLYNEAQIQNEIAFNNAALDKFGITEEEKLKVTLKRLDEQKKLEISQAEGNAAKIAEINAKYDKQSIEAKKAAIKAVLDENLRILDIYGEADRAANTRILESSKTTYNQKITASKSLLDAELTRLELEHKALTEQVEQNLITAKEFDIAYQDILNRRAAATEANEKRITAETLKEIEKRAAAIKAVFSIFQKGLQDTLGTNGLSVALTEMQNFGLAAKDIFDKVKSGAISSKEGIKELAVAAIAATQLIINQVFADSAAARQQQLSDTLALLEEQKAKELDNKNLTEQQKADIEEKYKQRERQEKIKAFQADKEAKKQQAAVNAALAITQAFATNPFPYSLIVAAIVAASTAIQIAKINSTPIPKFKSGKQKGSYEGLGIVNDGGRIEPILRADGSIEMATGKPKDRLTYLGLNDMVFPSMEHLYKHFNFPQIPTFVETNNSGSQQIDYNKLAEAVATKMAGIIPSPAQIHNNFDGEEVKKFIVSGNTKTEIKNKYFSMQ